VVNKLRMKEKLLIIILILNINLIYSQQVFKEYGERETVDILDSELLRLVCENSQFKYEDIYLNESFSKKYNEKFTFFSLRYITNKTELENFYTTIFLLVNKNGIILSELKNNDLIYSDNEAVQPYPTKILKKNIFLNENLNGIAVITKFSSPSRISLYSEELFSIIKIENNSMKVILENYPIRKTQGESNGSGNFEIEIIESLFFLEKEKSNNLYNLKVLQNFEFEENIEKDSSRNIKASNKKKEAKENEIITYNGEKYDFKQVEYKFLKDY
ncbi:hypothetical protein, partial [Zunongwangia atlantica]